MSEKKPWGLVWALSLAQLIAWGSQYYGFAVIVDPMEAELGWSRTALNGALSVGLLSWGLAAPLIGHWIDRHGGYAVMTAASILGGAMLIAWSQVTNLAVFYVIWFLLGIAMAGLLYDPAFAVLAQLFGRDMRRAITAMTLVGGFASTVFIPLIQWGVDLLGWRSALLWVGILNLVVCTLIHIVGLRSLPPPPVPARPAAARGGWVWAALTDPVFLGLALWFSAQSALVSGLIFHLIPAMTERGATLAAIITAIAIVGPMQVAGRLCLMMFGKSLHTPQMGAFTLAAMTGAVIVQALAPADAVWLNAFGFLFGAAGGVMTIARGMAVPDLLGAGGYASLNGLLTLPANIARALAPVALAAVWAAAGTPRAVAWAGLVLVALAWAGFFLAVRRRL